MDDKQVNPTTNSTDEPDNELPAVQQGQTGNDQADDNSPNIPADRALVAMPEEAADNDLIEKEWVIKAKEIVEKTSEDPFMQQEQLAKMKADYLKKRYNKDVGTV